MRKAVKIPYSKIVTESLIYSTGNSLRNKKIADILFTEQKGFCAYTEEYLSRTDSKDIEHFDPTLKDQPEDNYNNWFLVKHQWNLEKSEKWRDYQPILHPTADDFEKRIVYSGGDYILAFDTDKEAYNLIKLLQLDDAALADKRKKYINRKREEIKAFGESTKDFFSTLINDDKCSVAYSRAIEEEFEINLLELL